jgi:hypothetical protein
MPHRCCDSTVRMLNTVRVLHRNPLSSAGGGVNGSGTGSRFGPRLAPVTKAQIVLETLLAEIRIVLNETLQDRPAEDAPKITVSEFHGASISQGWCK